MLQMLAVLFEESFGVAVAVFVGVRDGVKVGVRDGVSEGVNVFLLSLGFVVF